MVGGAAFFPAKQTEYCVRIEAWELASGERVERTACVDGPSDIGAQREAYGDLGRCAGPPVAGGWGYDVRGSVEARQDGDWPSASEAVQRAWCEARSDALEDAVEGGAANSERASYAHYCEAEQETSAPSEPDRPLEDKVVHNRGCALAPSGGTRGAPLVLGLAIAALLRRRRGSASRQ